MNEQEPTKEEGEGKINVEGEVKANVTQPSLVDEVNAILGSIPSVNIKEFLHDDVLSQIRDEVLRGEEVITGLNDKQGGEAETTKQEHNTEVADDDAKDLDNVDKDPNMLVDCELLSDEDDDEL